MAQCDELLAQMSAARIELDAAVARLDGREEQDLGDGWRVCDVLAHIALWERVAVWKLLGTPVPHAEGLVDREPWDQDVFNEGMRERWRSRPLDDVLTELNMAHAALLAAVANASDDECAAGGRVWTVIDEDGAGHYEHHLADLRATR